MKCSGCFLTVAPNDPEKIQKNLEVFHGNCYRRRQKEQQQEMQRQLVASPRRKEPYYRRLTYDTVQ